jgi:hypothetical protein
MPDHPMIRWETDGGALLPVDRIVRTRDPGYAGDPTYADTQRKNNVDGEHVKDSKAGKLSRRSRELFRARELAPGAPLTHRVARNYVQTP